MSSSVPAISKSDENHFKKFLKTILVAALKIQ